MKQRAWLVLLAAIAVIAGCSDDVPCPSCEEEDWQVVEGAGDPAVDLAAVQSAVDQGGVVWLTGTFDFGEEEDAQVRIDNDVVIVGDVGAEGNPRAVIENGVEPFFCDNPDVDVRIENLQFGRDASQVGTANAAGPVFRAIHIQRARNVALVNNRIASIRSRLFSWAGEAPIGVGVGFMIGVEDGTLSEFEEVQVISNRMDLGYYEDTGDGVEIVSTTVYSTERVPWAQQYPEGWPDRANSRSFFGMLVQEVNGTFLVYGNEIRNTNGGGIYFVDAHGDVSEAPAHVVISNNYLRSGPFAGFQHGDEQYRGIFALGGYRRLTWTNADVTVVNNHIEVETRSGYGIWAIRVRTMTARHNHISVAQRNTDEVGWSGSSMNVGLWFSQVNGYEDISLNNIEGDGDAGIRVAGSSGNRFNDNVFVGFEDGYYYYFDATSGGNTVRGEGLTEDNVYDPTGNNEIVSP